MSDLVQKKFKVTGWVSDVDRDSAEELIRSVNMGYSGDLYDHQYHLALVTEPATSDEQYALMWANGMSLKQILAIMRAEAER